MRATVWAALVAACAGVATLVLLLGPLLLRPPASAAHLSLPALSRAWHAHDTSRPTDAVGPARRMMTHPRRLRARGVLGGPTSDALRPGGVAAPLRAQESVGTPLAQAGALDEPLARAVAAAQQRALDVVRKHHAAQALRSVGGANASSLVPPGGACAQLDARVLLYLRVPKTGSSTLLAHMRPRTGKGGRIKHTRDRGSRFHTDSDHKWRRRPRAAVRRAGAALLADLGVGRVTLGQHLMWDDVAGIGLRGEVSTKAIQMLRDPVQRCASAYYYSTRADFNDWHMTTAPLPDTCLLYPPGPREAHGQRDGRDDRGGSDTLAPARCRGDGAAWQKECVRPVCQPLLMLGMSRANSSSPRVRSMLLWECLLSRKCMRSSAGEGSTSLRGPSRTAPAWTAGTPVPVTTPWARTESTDASTLPRLLQDECRNYQTKWLCGTSDECMDASSPTALAAAVRRLHTAYDVVGVVEHMDDSVRLMARRLPKFFPSVDTTSPSALHLNRNPHPPVSALASGLLSAWNSNDLALYAEAERLLHKAIATCVGEPRWRPRPPAAVAM